MNPKKIFDYAREAEAILILNGGENNLDKNFFYLAGKEGGLYEGSFILAKPDSVTIFTSVLEEESARNTGNKVEIFHSRDEYENLLKNSLKDVNVVGLNYSSLNLEIYKNLLKIIPDKEFVDVSVSISEARRLKTPEELKNLREAAKIGSEAFEPAIEKLREGMTEKEVAANIVHEMMKGGASGPSFDTIVAFGENSSMPHYSPGNRKLKKGDIVLIDYGALYEGYCSDITRTISFGKASEKTKDMYSVVYKAQNESMKAIRANINGKDIDKIARDIIDASPYKGRFIHSLGHGVGMDVHDHPALAPNYDFPLKANMVVTDEPGVYLTGYGGIRIEDDVIVKEDGFEKISKGATATIREV